MYVIFSIKSAFLNRLLTFDILFSIAVGAVVVAKLVILGIFFSESLSVTFNLFC